MNANGQSEVSWRFPVPRRERVVALLVQERLDCCITIGQRFATWLTGYYSYFGGLSASIVEPNGRVTLIVSPDEVPLAEAASTADGVLPFGVAGFGLQLDSLSPLLEAIARVRSVKTATRIGIAGLPSRPTDWLGSAEVIYLHEQLHSLSLVKDADEFQKILDAYNLCWLAQEAVEAAFGADASEIEMFSAALSAAQVAHGSPIDFVADLLVGERTGSVCCPVVVAGQRRASPSDWVVADVALGASSYWGDTCRTYVGPRAPERVVDAIDKLTGLRDELAAGVRPGAVASDIYLKAESMLLEQFPGGTFPHHAGHGVGLSGFEYPHLIPDDSSTIQEGMVLAIEPGIYFPGSWGARVEQLFVVTERGGVELGDATTRAPRCNENGANSQT